MPRSTPSARLATAAAIVMALAEPRAAVATIGGKPAVSLPPGALAAVPGPDYVALADLVADTPIVLTARIVEALPLRESPIAATAASRTRYYIVADVTGLIRGAAAGLPPRIAWLADVAADARGKLPRLRKAQVIVAALPVADRPGELRLAARDAMLAWTAPLEARTRAIVAAAVAPDAPPRATGLASAFHVAGTLPGEGETQVFVTTDAGRPVSLSILRRPGQAPTLAVALGEIVDEAAAAPARDTLGWYRLACFLPPMLPELAVRDLAAEDAGAARLDYTTALDLLGRCTRTR